MVTIRLSRGGAKKKPFTTSQSVIVAGRAMADSLSELDSSILLLEVRKERLRLDLGRMAFWKSQGAQISPRVASLASDAEASDKAAQS